ncbi:MAG: hypothetical protein IPL53_25025 [Ignavibacteria bacterium]|nr:hypothetical protein [Ignavibacteria bacterium]
MIFTKPFVIIPGLVAAPIVATYVLKNSSVRGKVSPVIARIFSPVGFDYTSSVYLIAIIATGKDPYNDREFF